jgi:hypothetical protein
MAASRAVHRPAPAVPVDGFGHEALVKGGQRAMDLLLAAAAE